MKFLLNKRRKTLDFSSSLQDPRGSILIVCFFVLVLLTMFTITVGYTMRQKIQVLSRLDTRQKLRLIGEAGVQKAVYELLKYKERQLPYDALNQSWSRNESGFKNIEVGDGLFSVYYSVETSRKKGLPAGEDKRYGLVDEERKININLIQSPDVLRRLFKKAGALDEDEAATVVDSIRDWEDEDDHTSSAGAESGHYKGLSPAYAPRNGKLVDLAELQWIKGMKPEILEKVRPYITLDSSGKVNLNTASKTVLMTIGISGDICDKILTYRNGRDQLEGTGDDKVFDDLATAVQLLANESYLNDNERTDLETVIQSGILTVRSQFFTAQVTAQLKHKTQSLRILAVFDQKGVIQRWEETFAVT